jgi:hypothetical protein
MEADNEGFKPLLAGVTSLRHPVHTLLARYSQSLARYDCKFVIPDAIMTSSLWRVRAWVFLRRVIVASADCVALTVQYMCTVAVLRDQVRINVCASVAARNW